MTRDVPDFAADSPLLANAYRFAREAHHGERRTDDTPIEHPTEVARLLHDVVEDSTTDVEELRERFGRQVADLVAGMTEDESLEGYAQRKAAHRDQVRAAGRDTAAIFAADKLANVRDMAGGASSPDDAKLDHYQRTLADLCAEHPDLDFLSALARELRGLRPRYSPPE